MKPAVQEQCPGAGCPNTYVQYVTYDASTRVIQTYRNIPRIIMKEIPNLYRNIHTVQKPYWAVLYCCTGTALVGMWPLANANAVYTY